MYTKIGRVILCFIITTIIYSILLCVYRASNRKVINENKQNKGKSLQSFIDRWKYSLYNGLGHIVNIVNYNNLESKRS